MRQSFVDLIDRSWNRTKHFVVHNVLHADDPPHRLAMGVAIAMFVTFTPTIGLQMALVVGLAWLFKANKLVGVPLVWISNPATMVPILYGCYWVGKKILGGPGISADWFSTLNEPPPGFAGSVHFYWDRLSEIAGPLWLGSIVIGGVLSSISYYVTLQAVCKYRMRKWGQLMPPAEQPPTVALTAPLTSQAKTAEQQSTEESMTDEQTNENLNAVDGASDDSQTDDVPSKDALNANALTANALNANPPAAAPPEEANGACDDSMDETGIEDATSIRRNDSVSLAEPSNPPESGRPLEKRIARLAATFTMTHSDLD
jgi:uncharacterized protein (DUF2062 family)